MHHSKPGSIHETQRSLRRILKSASAMAATLKFYESGVTPGLVEDADRQIAAMEKDLSAIKNHLHRIKVEVTSERIAVPSVVSTGGLVILKRTKDARSATAHGTEQS